MRPEFSWMLSLPLLSAAVADLCPGSPGGPTVVSPGLVDCASENTSTGTRTTFTLHDDTILRWGLFGLPDGDELVFDFMGGERVANLLGSGHAHRIDGTVTSNGVIGFFSEGRGLEVNGSMQAKGVVLSSLAISNAEDFVDRKEYHLSGSGGFQPLTIRGEVIATGGDLVAAGNVVRVTGDSKLRASRAIRVAAGNDVEVDVSGQQRIQASGGVGILLHLGDSRAGSLELVASGQELDNAGRLEAGGGTGKIFMEVGSGGVIRNEGTGVIFGRASFDGALDSDGIVLDGDNLDPLQAVNSSVLRVPALRDPEGRLVSKARRVETNTAMSGSADALRQPKAKKKKQLAQQGRKPLLRRQSFFGMRGGKRE